MRRLEKRLFMEVVSHSPQMEAEEQFWVHQGKMVFVHNEIVSVGNFYLAPKCNEGSRLVSYAIDLSLPIDEKGVDFKKRVLSKKPCYRQASPSCRATYLKWLAEDMPREVHIGYPLLYFHGLEHYYFLGKSDTYRKIVKERFFSLKEDFFHDAIFRERATYFGFVNQMIEASSEGVDLNTCSPFSLSVMKKIPMAVRYVCSKVALERKPLSKEWALALILSHPKMNLRESILRVLDVFKELFFESYDKYYGDGIFIDYVGSEIPFKHWNGRYDYDFSHMMGSENSFVDVVDSSPSILKLLDFADEISKGVVPYSRFLARNSWEKGGLYESLKLPNLLRNRQNEVLKKLLDFCDQRCGSQRLGILSIGELDSLTTQKRGFRLSLDSLKLLESFLDKYDFKLVPHPDWQLFILKRMQQVVVCRKDGKTLENHQKDMIIELGFIFTLVAFFMKGTTYLREGGARDIVSLLCELYPPLEHSKMELESYLTFWGLNPLLMKDVVALFHEHKDRENFKGCIQISLLILIYCDLLGKETLEKVTRILEYVGISAEVLYSYVNHVNFFDGKEFLQAHIVDYLQGRLQVSFSLASASGNDVSSSESIRLDQDKLEKKVHETRKVNLLLDDVFQDDTTQVNQEDSQEGSQEGDSPWLRLREDLREVVLKLVENNGIWLYSDFEEEMAAKKLFANVVVEDINDWSFEVLDEVLLWRDEENLNIYLEIWKDFESMVVKK